MIRTRKSDRNRFDSDLYCLGPKDFFIIGVAGQKRAGKDTFAQTIENKNKRTTVTEAFAEPIYRAAAEICNMELQSFCEFPKEQMLPRYGVTKRQMLQTLGTEWGREKINDNIWILNLVQRVTNKIKYGVYHNIKLLIIPDVRFDNEAEFIKSKRGTVVFIRTKLPNNDSHKSEAGIQEKFIGSVIYNTGSIQDYRTKIARWVKENVPQKYIISRDK